MTKNIFSFANTFWLQLTGTAMGTPAACSYATISYGQHENSQVLPKFRHHLLYYKRYIDDIFGIWLPSNTDEEASWINFKNELNNWSGLHWNVEELSTQTVFLDLNITLTNSRIHTSTYQKEYHSIQARTLSTQVPQAHSWSPGTAFRWHTLQHSVHRGYQQHRHKDISHTQSCTSTTQYRYPLSFYPVLSVLL